MKKGIIVALLVVVIAVGAYVVGRRQAAPTQPTPSPTATSSVPVSTSLSSSTIVAMIANGTFPRYMSPAEATGTAQFVDGQATFEVSEGKGAITSEQPMITVRETLYKIAPGDLTGDQVVDAAAMFAYSAGGTGSFVSAVAFVQQDGKMHLVDAYTLGDREDVKTVSVDNNIITINYITHGSDDPSCCPSLPTVLKLKLSNGKLIRIS